MIMDKITDEYTGLCQVDIYLDNALQSLSKRYFEIKSLTTY